MATVLALLCSGRRKGYTAGLWRRAIDGMRRVASVEVDEAWLHHYRFGPCVSDFRCIRDERHECILDDDMGRGGAGPLWQKVMRANGLLLADPVHGWSTSAGAKLFMERLYPSLWSGRLQGLPFASISCASNQGFQHQALRTMCMWAYQGNFLWVGGLAVHLVDYPASLGQAEQLGEALARAALKDATQGRQARSERERNLAFLDTPWSILEPYLDNLTRGSRRYEDSYLAQALAEGTFSHPEAGPLAQKAAEALREALDHYHAGRRVAAVEALTRLSAYWTHATWKQFLEEGVIGAKQPDSYRPLPADG